MDVLDEPVADAIAAAADDGANADAQIDALWGPDVHGEDCREQRAILYDLFRQYLIFLFFGDLVACALATTRYRYAACTTR